MDEPQQRAGPPAVRPQGPLPAVPSPAFPPPGPPTATKRAGTAWKRLTRTRRGAAGVAIIAAALLLWPFAGWSWIPWAAGAGAVVLLALLRLDRLLQGWVWHVGGLVVVGGLMYSTGPAAWALAASIGVLVAGLLQLPAWRLAAVGAVLCVASGVVFGLTQIQDAREAAAAQVQVQEQSRGLQGARSATSLLPTLLNRIALDSPGAVCDNLLAEPARAPFAASVGRPDCAAAVAAVAAEVTAPDDYADADAPTREQGSALVIDACRLTWGDGPPAGPQLGVLTVGRAPTGPTFVVTDFQACAP